jgi:hypothetical protein
MQISKIRENKRDIIADAMEIQRIFEDFFERSR